jgi:hypothetical protein
MVVTRSKVPTRICIEDIANNAHLQKHGYLSGIWRLKVPPRVKNLVWRVCRDCFPTSVRLIRRGVNCPSACVKCDDPHEDNYHIFFSLEDRNRCLERCKCLAFDCTIPESV